MGFVLSLTRFSFEFLLLLLFGQGTALLSSLSVTHSHHTWESSGCMVAVISSHWLEIESEQS
jgi:hypothetical protein